MAVASGEYYYNWYAAKANPYQCLNPTSSMNATATNDGYALGSICPAGWTLPADGSGDLQINNSTFRTALVNNGSLATSGIFFSGSQSGLGSRGRWWSSTRDSISNAGSLALNGTSADRELHTKRYGFSVRCMRSS